MTGAAEPKPVRAEEGRRFLLVTLHPGYLRNHENALRTLLGRGHSVHVLFLQSQKATTDRFADRLADAHPNFSHSRAPKVRRTGWTNLRAVLRTQADLVRYQHPRYAASSALYDRASGKLLGMRRLGGLLPPVIALGYPPTLGRITGATYADWLTRGLLALAEGTPSDPGVDSQIARRRPDVVLASPHVAIGTTEHEYLHSAKRLGARTGLLVASWDNLTNKGLIKSVPDRVFVWNEPQIKEAIELHGIPRDRLVATGAPRLDEWFEQEPASEPAEFCTRVGLDAGHPFILYLGSSPFIALDEVTFVKRLIAEIRSSGGEFAAVGVLVRPHPQNAGQWSDPELDGLKNVAVWPKAGEQPVAAASKATFFDSMFHSIAVVGVNTSAQIEAGIVGRTVHTVLDEQFALTQEGTLHFRHLLAENGGLLHAARDIPELVRNLREVQEGRADLSQTSRFIHSFIRPGGLDVPATEVLAAALEDLAYAAPPAPTQPLTGSSRHAVVSVLATLSAPLDRGSVLRVVRSRLAAVRARGSAELRRALPVLEPHLRELGKLGRVRPRKLLALSIIGTRRRIARFDPRREAPSVDASRPAAAPHVRPSETMLASVLTAPAPVLDPAVPAMPRLELLPRKNALRLADRQDRCLLVLPPWPGDRAGEILYWIPYVRALRHEAVGRGAAVVAVLRPSAPPEWYEGAADFAVVPGLAGDSEAAVAIEETALTEAMRLGRDVAVIVAADELHAQVNAFRKERVALRSVRALLDVRRFPRSGRDADDVPACVTQDLGEAAYAVVLGRPTTLVVGRGARCAAGDLDMLDRTALQLGVPFQTVPADAVAALDPVVHALAQRPGG